MPVDSTTPTKPPDPPPPPDTPDTLRPTPEFQRRLDEFASRKEAGQASGELANPGNRSTDKGLEPAPEFQQSVDEFRARKEDQQASVDPDARATTEQSQPPDQNGRGTPEPVRTDLPGNVSGREAEDRPKPDGPTDHGPSESPGHRSSDETGVAPDGSRDARSDQRATEDVEDPAVQGESGADAEGLRPEPARSDERPAPDRADTVRPAADDAGTDEPGESADLDEKLNRLAGEIVENRRERDDDERADGPGDGTGGPPPGGPVDTSPPGPNRDRVDADETTVQAISTFLPPSGDGPTSVRAVDPADFYPGWQDDNNGKNPMDDYRRDIRQHPDGTGLDPKHSPLFAGLESGAAPQEVLYKGGPIPESTLDTWKRELVGDGRPVMSADARSTSLDPITALTYGENRTSQSIGRPIAPGDGTEPGPNGSGQDVDRSQNVPGHELLAPAGFAAEYTERMEAALARGDDAAVERLERLHETVAPRLDGSGDLPAMPYREGVRRDGMEERVLVGKYELVGLLDSRPGHEYHFGEISSVRLPGGGDPPPGVYPVFRPVSLD